MIYLLEDDDILLDVMSLILDKHQRIHRAFSEALRMFQALHDQHCDLLITDLSMAHVGGEGALPTLLDALESATSRVRVLEHALAACKLRHSEGEMECRAFGSDAVE